jgi:pseudouridine kinase
VDEQCHHVLVIGAANLDVKGRPESALIRGSSAPGIIRSSLGGVARNIAENLVRLDVPTVLITAVGDDQTGERLLGRAAGRGIDISEVLIVEGRRTGSYMALLTAEGTRDVALHDMGIIEEITPAYLDERRPLFEDACLVVIDANLTPPTIAKVVELCDEYGVPLCADPTSTLLAGRLRPHLAHLYMASPDVQEASALCGMDFDPNDRDAALEAAARLVSMGVDLAVITMGEFGAIYADGDTSGHVPAIITEVVDPTGAGDALTAAIIFGLLEEIPLDECVRLGVTAASLTLRSRDSVRPDLSVDLLYDELAT